MIWKNRTLYFAEFPIAKIYQYYSDAFIWIFPRSSVIVTNNHHFNIQSIKSEIQQSFVDTLIHSTFKFKVVKNEFRVLTFGDNFELCLFVLEHGVWKVYDVLGNEKTLTTPFKNFDQIKTHMKELFMLELILELKSALGKF